MWTTLLLIAATCSAQLPPTSAGTLRLLLIRHGEALSNLDPEPDVPPAELDHLTERGRAQVQALAESLAGCGVARLASSPAGRAQETAGLLSAALGAPTAIEPRVRPLDLGRRADGQPLDWDARIAEWESGRDPRPAGGESLEDVGARVAELAASLVAASPDTTVALVAHSEVIGAYLGALADTPPAQRWPPTAPLASISVVEVSPDGAARILVRARR